MKWQWGLVTGLVLSSTALAQSPAPATTAVRITLDEAKQRALANNKLLNIGSLNAESKAFAVKAAQADYFPKVAGSAFYLHFNDPLGKVLTTQGRTVTGPLGRALVTFPPTAVEAAVMNQDSSIASVMAVQPITDLLLVRQGVKIAQADEQIAHAQLQGGMRKVASGVEQLYWGMLAVRRIRDGAADGVKGAEMLAATKTVEARTALVEARQGLQQANKQLADLQEQMNALLDLPLDTTLELVEPPLPVMPYRSAEEVIALALASSPEIAEAQATVGKAQAAVAAGKLAYVPSIGLVGGYANQTGASYIQQDIGFVGVVGSYTFVDWGKRKNVVRERQNLHSMACLKLQQTQDEVRQKAQRAFRDVAESQQAVTTATELAALRKEAEGNAKTPADLMTTATARALADVDYVKADLAYRQAYVDLMSLVGKQ
jgi:outer membrane protein TolC